MKMIVLMFLLIVSLSSNVYAAGLSVAGLNAERLNSACSADKAQVEFLLCLTYFGGWLEGVMSQRLHTTMERRRFGSKNPMPPWAKTRAYQCLDLRTSEEELAKKYVSWFNSKVSTLRKNDIKSFKKIGAGAAISNMMKEIYFCKH